MGRVVVLPAPLTRISTSRPSITWNVPLRRRPRGQVPTAGCGDVRVSRRASLRFRVQTPRLAFWGIRSWIVSGFERHEVFYRVTEEGIAVVRVLHSGPRALTRSRVVTLLQSQTIAESASLCGIEVDWRKGLLLSQGGTDAPRNEVPHFGRERERICGYGTISIPPRRRTSGSHFAQHFRRSPELLGEPQIHLPLLAHHHPRQMCGTSSSLPPPPADVTPQANRPGRKKYVFTQVYEQRVAYLHCR